MASPSVVLHTTEIKTDKTPQITGTLPNGTSLYSEHDKYGIESNYVVTSGGTSTQWYRTTYTTRPSSERGTFPLEGGQMELSEFDTGVNSNNYTGSGTLHRYTDFPDISDNGDYDSTTLPTPYGPPTRYAPSSPYANVEANSSWISTSIQGYAGIGFSDGTESLDDDGVVYVSSFNDIPVYDGTGAQIDTIFTASLFNIGTKTGTEGTATTTFDVPLEGGGTRAYIATWNKIPEIWYPGLSFQNSTSLYTPIKGSIVFKVYPDSEYTMSRHMTATTATVSSISISPISANDLPIARCSEATVTTTSNHKLADNQNQVIISGAYPTYVNGLHNVHSVSSDTTFTILLPKSTSSSGESVNVSNVSLITHDGIDITNAVLRFTSDGTGDVQANVVHGGCAGNNAVILKGTPSIQRGRVYYVYSNESQTTPLTTVQFTTGPRYRSLFNEAGLYLNQATGQVTSNGKFNGIHSTKGIKELDSFFPKFKHARDQALNRIKTDGTITQSNPAGDGEGEIVTITGGSNLPNTAFFKTLTYSNGFTTNVSFKMATNQITVQHTAQITEGEPYTLRYEDRVYPVPNTSSYWSYEFVQNLMLNQRDLDDSKPAYISTHQMFNTPVHFTIRAMKNTSHLSAASLSTSTTTISGWGTYETESGNYYDADNFIRIYSVAESDRDSFVSVYVDQNNVSSTSVDFNRNDNAFAINDQPVTNQQFLANNYSNGNFTVLSSV